MGGQDAECGGRYAVEPASLPHCARSRCLEFSTGFIGKTGDRIEIDASQNQSFVAPEGFDVGDLTLQIDIVFGIDVEMDGDP